MFINTTGNGNTASGPNALFSNTTGHVNTALGFSAGHSVTTGSYNIHIGAENRGYSTDDRVIRLGWAGNQTRTFVAGIRGVTTGLNNAVMCVTCHNPHGTDLYVFDPGGIGGAIPDNNMLRLRDEDDTLCNACH